MSEIRAKKLAEIGQLCLKEAVLEVLCDAKREGGPLGPSKVSERAGIARGGDKFNDAIAGGILFLLEVDGKVQNPKRGQWIITDEEFNRRNAG